MARGTTSARAQFAAYATAFLALQCQQLLTGVRGHLYMMSPVSRNYYETSVFQESATEYCPTCMQAKGPAAVRARAEANTDSTELSLYGNGSWPHYSAYLRSELLSNGNFLETDGISVRHGICGDPGQTQDEDDNRYGLSNDNYPVVATLQMGSEVDFKINVGTGHMGHFEFFICPTDDLEGDTVIQSCFNEYPLDRAEDSNGAPIDPDYPGRYFLDPSCRASSGETDQTKPDSTDSGYVVTAKYQLPEDLTCDRCVIQMVYYTGNSCMYPGYEEFSPDSWNSDCAPDKESWISTELGMCGDGDNYPEEYWNCADVTITADGTSTSIASSLGTSSGSTYGGNTYGDSTSGSSTSGSSTSGSSTTGSSTTGSSTTGSSASGSSTSADAPSPTPQPSPAPTEGSATSGSIEEFVSTETTPSTGTASSSGAASSSGTASSSGDCDGDVLSAYDQCGGDGYTGSTCCPSDYECQEMADCYSECRPSSCAELYGQCGGSSWSGPFCCQDGLECDELTDGFSQCVESTSS